MSKILTNSETLRAWFDKPANGNSRLEEMIAQLKQAIVDNTELQMSIMDGAVIDKLQSVNMSVVWVLRDLQKIKAEFDDMTAE